MKVPREFYNEKLSSAKKNPKVSVSGHKNKFKYFSSIFEVFLACPFCVFAVFLLLFIYILGRVITQTAYTRTVWSVILNIEAIFPMCDFCVWCNKLVSVVIGRGAASVSWRGSAFPIQITFNHNSQWRPPSDYNARLVARWSPRGLSHTIWQHATLLTIFYSRGQTGVTDNM